MQFLHVPTNTDLRGSRHGWRRRCEPPGGYRIPILEHCGFGFSRHKPTFGALRALPGFGRTAAVVRPIERRIGVSAKAIAVEIERMVVAGRGVLYEGRFLDEFVPI